MTTSSDNNTFDTHNLTIKPLEYFAHFFFQFHRNKNTFKPSFILKFINRNI